MKVPDIFFVARIWSQHGANVNIEITFCGKLKRGVHDQNVRIDCIYKFAIEYNGTFVGFD